MMAHCCSRASGVEIESLFSKLLNGILFGVCDTINQSARYFDSSTAIGQKSRTRVDNFRARL